MRNSMSMTSSIIARANTGYTLDPRAFAKRATEVYKVKEEEEKRDAAKAIVKKFDDAVLKAEKKLDKTASINDAVATYSRTCRKLNEAMRDKDYELTVKHYGTLKALAKFYGAEVLRDRIMKGITPDVLLNEAEFEAKLSSVVTIDYIDDLIEAVKVGLAGRKAKARLMTEIIRDKAMERYMHELTEMTSQQAVSFNEQALKDQMGGCSLNPFFPFSDAAVAAKPMVTEGQGMKVPERDVGGVNVVDPIVPLVPTEVSGTVSVEVPADAGKVDLVKAAEKAAEAEKAGGHTTSFANALANASRGKQGK